jgi:hypothetical protein
MTTILTHTFRINATSKNDTKPKQSKTNKGKTQKLRKILKKDKQTNIPS